MEAEGSAEGDDSLLGVTSPLIDVVIEADTEGLAVPELLGDTVVGPVSVGVGTSLLVWGDADVESDGRSEMVSVAGGENVRVPKSDVVPEDVNEPAADAVSDAETLAVALKLSVALPEVLAQRVC